MSSLMQSARFLVIGSAIMAVPCVGIAQTHPASASEVTIPLRDARKAGANAVRFAAQQQTRNAPVVVIFGVTKANWSKLRSAVQLAVFQGSRVEGIFIGPDSPPGIEIYAHGHQMSVNGLNPDTLSGPDLTRLIADIWREHYQ